MEATAVTGEAELTVATLHERYEQRAFDLAYRIVGSQADAADVVRGAFLNLMRKPPAPTDDESALDSLFTETRNASHTLMRKRADGRAWEPDGSVEDREISEANMRLPLRQREALALRELEEVSYEKIARIVEVSRGSVAQLLSRARINLSDELHGTILASVAAPSAECERALPLIAARDDAQLEPGSPDAAWLDGHLADCERCRLGVDAMQKARASYRAWAPIPATSSRVESQPERRAARKASKDPRRPRGRVTLAAAFAALLLLAGLAAALAANDPSTSIDSAAGTPVEPRVVGRGGSVDRLGTGKSKKRTERKAADVVAAAEEAPPVQIASEGGSGDEPASPGKSQSGDIGIQPTQPTSDPKPKPNPTAAPAPAPTSTAAQASPPEEAEKTHGRAEPPGKPSDRPPR